MRITWVTRSFLDYRIPVYQELDRFCDQNLSVIYYRDIVPERCREKLAGILNDRAVELSGELLLSGRKSNPVARLKRGGVRIPWQPGLLDAIQKSRPDVMISDGFFQWTYAPLLLRGFRGIPHVMCYEPTPWTERNAQWFRTVYRKLAARWIDAVCCNGELCRRYTRSLGIPDNKIFLGNMAADSDILARKCSEFSPGDAGEFKDRNHLKSPVFLYVGRLVELKGLQRLLNAWSVVRPNASLLLAGDGPERPGLERFCREKKLDNVIFAGTVDYDSLPIYYRSADVFIIPTLQDNWSLVVPEAMACGLPIACSKYNGCHPELVHPENGWVFDPLDERETVAMLRNILSRREQLSAMGKESKRIVGDFSPEKIARNIYQACEKARNK